MIKRYQVFSGYNYYPSGGWEDHLGSADTMEEAFIEAANSRGDWWHIVDMETGDIVQSGRRQ